MHFFRRHHALTIAFLLCLIPHLAVAFTDVAADLPQYSSIENFKQLGIIQGYDDGTFKPEQQITRAEALKVILLSEPDAEATTEAGELTITFTDVPSDQWFALLVEEGVGRGLIQGFSEDNSFRPAQSITLAEAIKVATLAHYGELPELTNQQKLLKLKEAWHNEYMQLAFSQNLVDLSATGTIAPDQAVTRAELVELLYRIRNSSIDQPYNLANNWPITTTEAGFNFRHPSKLAGWQVLKIDTDKLIVYRRDPRYSQALISRIYPRSAHIVFEKLTLNTGIATSTLFDELKQEYQELYDETKIEFSNPQYDGQTALVVTVANQQGQNLRDLYLPLNDREVLVAQGNYGISELSPQLYKEVSTIQSSISTQEPDTVIERSDDSTEGEGAGGPEPILFSPTSLTASVRTYLLVDGQGQNALRILPDHELIQTTSSPTTGNQIEFYYSALADLTLKYDSDTATLLAIREGKVTSF